MSDGEGVNELAGGEVVEENRPVVAARDEGFSGSNVREAHDAALMAFEHVQELFGVGVRHSDAIVGPARDDD